MKKIKFKRILLLFTLTIAMIGCFFIKSSSVKASDELIMSLEYVGNSLKENLIYTDYNKNIDKVVCVTNQSSICFLDYKTLEYSDEIAIDGLPTNINQFQICLCGNKLVVFDSSSKGSKAKLIIIDLINYTSINLVLDLSLSSNDNISLLNKDDNNIYIGRLGFGNYDWYYIYRYNLINHDLVTLYSFQTNGIYFLNFSGDNKFYISIREDSVGYFYDKNTKTLNSNSYYNLGKGYEFDNIAIFAPTKGSAYFKLYNYNDDSITSLDYKPNTTCVYLSFRVNNSIFLIPKMKSGYIMNFNINDFQLEGENLVFTTVNNPLSYQDILSNYIPSDKYGRSLMTSIKADSYYNSFSTPGNYDATITVSDGYCHEDFDITIVVNKGGGEEEKKEESGTSIKWDTNLMIQSFGGIAVFLVIGLLVVSIIKKILR